MTPKLVTSPSLVPSPILSFNLSLGHRGRRLQTPCGTTGHVPRLARLLALALKLDRQVRNGTLGNYAQLARLGYQVIPSEANFFMVHIRRPVSSVTGEFRRRGVLVGRPFPPMNDYLRVSVGNADEMGRFLAAFQEILPAGPGAAAAKPG